MTDKEKIRNIIELFIAWNGETDVIDVANIDSAVEFISNSLQEEPISEELNKAAIDYAESVDYRGFSNAPWNFVQDVFKAGAQWQKEQLIKKAIDGTARPDDSEVWCDLKSFNLKDGDKVKVVVIKED